MDRIGCLEEGSDQEAGCSDRLRGSEAFALTADNLGRFAQEATLRPLRIAREAYETAALPLNYVGVRPSIGDDCGQLLLRERAIPARINHLSCCHTSLQQITVHPSRRILPGQSRAAFSSIRARIRPNVGGWAARETRICDSR